MWLNYLAANFVGMEFKLSWERNIHRRVFTLSIKLEWSKTVLSDVSSLSKAVLTGCCAHAFADVSLNSENQPYIRTIYTLNKT